MNNLKESSIKTIVIHDYPNDDDLYNIYQEVKNAQKKMSPRVHLLLLVIKLTHVVRCYVFWKSFFIE